VKEALAKCTVSIRLETPSRQKPVDGQDVQTAKNAQVARALLRTVKEKQWKHSADNTENYVVLAYQ